MTVLYDDKGMAVGTANPLPIKIAGTEDTSGGALGVNVKSSEVIQPVDIQARYATTIQTHNAVSVGASSSSAQSSYMDANGFDKIAITFKNDANTNCAVNLYWSNDGTTMHSTEVVLSASARGNGTSELSIKARYVKVELVNSDTVAHVMSAWAYLKA